MAIEEETYGAQDCTLSVDTDSFSGTFVNWDDISRGFEHVVEGFTPNSSGVDKYTTPRKRVPPLRIRLTLGLGQTLLDLKQALDDQIVTEFVATGWPSHSAMVAEYGPLGVVSVNEVVGTRAQGEVVLQYGFTSHGYTPA